MYIYNIYIYTYILLLFLCCCFLTPTSADVLALKRFGQTCIDRRTQQRLYILKSGSLCKTKSMFSVSLSAGRESVFQSGTSSSPPPVSVIVMVSSPTPPSPFGSSLLLLVLSLLHQSVLLCDALSSELFQDVVQVSGVGEPVARQVGAKLCLMVDLVPDDGIRLSGSAGSPD